MAAGRRGSVIDGDGGYYAMDVPFASLLVTPSAIIDDE